MISGSTRWSNGTTIRPPPSPRRRISTPWQVRASALATPTPIQPAPRPAHPSSLDVTAIAPASSAPRAQTIFHSMNTHCPRRSSSRHSATNSPALVNGTSAAAVSAPTNSATGHTSPARWEGASRTTAGGTKPSTAPRTASLRPTPPAITPLTPLTGSTAKAPTSGSPGSPTMPHILPSTVRQATYTTTTSLTSTAPPPHAPFTKRSLKCSTAKSHASSAKST